MSKSPAWSYSALTAFETCPHRYYQTKIAKAVIEPQTEATLWGSRVHKAFENRIKDGTPISKELAQYNPIADKLVAACAGKKFATEQKLALNEHFLATTFFAKDVWLRSILDLIIENKDKALVIDLKTGKKNPESAQLQLFAGVIFAIKPWIKTVSTAFLWLKTNEVTREEFTREDVPHIWQTFLPRVQRLNDAFAQQKFPKRPSGLCRAWCPIKTCEFNGGYRGEKVQARDGDDSDVVRMA